MTSRLLWTDCISAFVAGALLLALAGWLAPLLGLPTWFVLGEGLVNLGYGAFSFSLARRPRIPRPLASRLAAMNVGWAVFCWTLAVMLAGTLTLLGTLHFVLGGGYVGGLGVLEWRHRDALATA